MPQAPFESSPRAHVLAYAGRGTVGQGELSLARSSTVFHGETEAGRTADIVVFTDNTPNGNASAQAILQTAEADFTATQQWFGGLALPQGQPGDDQTTPRTALPVQVLMDSQAGGAYHFGCNATDLYVEPAPQIASGFMVAELVEVFEAAINNGWQCGQTNGEALSRVLATERNNGLAQLQVQTGQAWWANGHQDYVTTNNATDQDENSNGCGPLFLYYLHSQLGYDWTRITTTGGASLGDTYQRLTGNAPAQGFQDFVNLLATLDNGSGLQLPASGNPFPIAGTGQAPSGSAGGGAAGGPAGGQAGTPAGGITLPQPPTGRGFAGPVTMLGLLILIVVALIVLNAIGAVQF
ncbi:MAG TPA: hypothetical protein VE338_15630 [Ktedonobacterales bacterium]|nr:hypothetical protein [Ktedonobacterales bacterium]